MSIDLARQIGKALNVKSETQIRALDQALSAYARLTTQSETVPMTGVIAASQVTSGSFANARIAAGNVTQHQAALAILAAQIAGGALANHVNDAAAAGGGIAVGSLYRNGSIVMVRVV